MQDTYFKERIQVKVQALTKDFKPFCRLKFNCKA